MRQAGTDYKHLLSVLQEIWDDGAFCGGADRVQRLFTCVEKLLEITRFLGIEFGDCGEIVSIAGKEVG